MGSDLPPAATGWCTSSTPGEKWVGTVGWQASSWLEQTTHIQSPKALLGVRHPVGWNRPPMCSHRRHYWVTGI